MRPPSEHRPACSPSREGTSAATRPADRVKEIRVLSTPRSSRTCGQTEGIRKIRHELQDGTMAWGKSSTFHASSYPGQASLQRVIVFSDMGLGAKEGSSELKGFQPGALVTTTWLYHWYGHQGIKVDEMCGWSIISRSNFLILVYLHNISVANY